MSALTRDLILKAEDLESEAVHVPEWGGVVQVKSMTGAQRDEFERKITTARKGDSMDLRGLKVMLVICTACDAAGEPLFKVDDAKELNKKSGKVIDRLFQVAQKLSGLTDEDAQELVKN